MTRHKSRKHAAEIKEKKENNPFACTLCESRFLVDKSLLRHMRNAHKGQNPVPNQQVNAAEVASLGGPVRTARRARPIFRVLLNMNPQDCEFYDRVKHQFKCPYCENSWGK
jgi:DNA-directed RNA polymerase subunit RPC12/RpoP